MPDFSINTNSSAANFSISAQTGTAGSEGSVAQQRIAANSPDHVNPENDPAPAGISSIQANERGAVPIPSASNSNVIGTETAEIQAAPNPPSSGIDANETKIGISKSNNTSVDQPLTNREPTKLFGDFYGAIQGELNVIIISPDAPLSIEDKNVKNVLDYLTKNNDTIWVTNEQGDLVIGSGITIYHSILANADKEFADLASLPEQDLERQTGLEEWIKKNNIKNRTDGGKNILAGGEIKLINNSASGKKFEVNNKSGHYLPSYERLFTDNTWLKFTELMELANQHPGFVEETGGIKGVTYSKYEPSPPPG